MVQRMLRLSAPPAPDAADALALALTHAQDTARFSLSPPKRIYRSVLIGCFNLSRFASTNARQTIIWK
jgi:hypothetical protein